MWSYLFQSYLSSYNKTLIGIWGKTIKAFSFINAISKMEA